MQKINQIDIEKCADKHIKAVERVDEVLLVFYNDKSFSYIDSYGESEFFSYEEIIDRVDLLEDGEYVFNDFVDLLIKYEIIDKDLLIQDAQSSLQQRKQYQYENKLHKLKLLAKELKFELIPEDKFPYYSTTKAKNQSLPALKTVQFKDLPSLDVYGFKNFGGVDFDTHIIISRNSIAMMKRFDPTVWEEQIRLVREVCLTRNCELTVEEFPEHLVLKLVPLIER